MRDELLVDVAFDFRTDATGPDVDSSSLTLKKYHQTLWSKLLPSGKKFALSDDRRGTYLTYEQGERIFYLSSDSISNSYRNNKRMYGIVKEIDELVAKFQDIGNTIGGYIIFPSKSDVKGLSINQERGVNHKIADRFDLTLECIRLHYLSQRNPLELVLKRSAEYFRLFATFHDYVKFFHLDDLVGANYDSINFFLSPDGFARGGLPQTQEEYLRYMEKSIEFTKKRNERIRSSCS
jgi:hypothetical protein